eukprot:CAMPEP_0170854502 /NCGR_PEP_ID=MMETSP0734-20130129/13244_1 /TAXON_ID=186038 /ORGANISM="Fragilariopsis kerguelensis, Strain L26-C5" /LENGTH=68 /DNA_ID=CAMNT_0011225579 /DNA_START=38 /DNA_END=245 /DNA_ORIENTATION=+
MNDIKSAEELIKDDSSQQLAWRCNGDGDQDKEGHGDKSNDGDRDKEGDRDNNREDSNNGDGDGYGIIK